MQTDTLAHMILYTQDDRLSLPPEVHAPTPLQILMALKECSA